MKTFLLLYPDYPAFLTCAQFVVNAETFRLVNLQQLKYVVQMHIPACTRIVVTGNSHFIWNLVEPSQLLVKNVLILK